jgi:hypothetical protein
LRDDFPYRRRARSNGMRAWIFSRRSHIALPLVSFRASKASCALCASLRAS